MPPRKQAPSSPKGPPKKRPKADVEQSTIGTFFTTPSKAARSSKQVVDLLSDSDADEITATGTEPVASTSGAKPPQNDNAVIDLDEVDSSDEDKKDVKPSTSFHSLFQQKRVKDENNDVKPAIQANGNGSLKGKGKAIDSPTKLVLPENASDSPIIYPLDKDIFVFEPDVDVDTSSWPRNTAGKLVIPYSFLTAAFVLISATRARLIITTVLTNTLRTVVHYQPEVLRETVYLVSLEYRQPAPGLRSSVQITNHVAPAYEGVELGIGSQVLGKALKAVSSVTGKELKQLWNKHGDVGDVAFEAKAK